MFYAPPHSPPWRRVGAPHSKVVTLLAPHVVLAFIRRMTVIMNVICFPRAISLIWKKLEVMPAVTRSVASASALRSGMLDLPQELQRLVAQSLLDIDFRAFLRLLQTCRALRSNFLPVLHARRAEDSARLNFAADSEGGRISAGGKTFTKRAASFSEIHQFMNDGCPLYAWATGHPLPLAGKFIWRVRLDVAHGSVWVGVCTADLKQAWALSMYDGAPP